MALDRENVVRTALRVLDEEGLDGLSLRRIARELDVQAPALYWHFASKQLLLDEMATTMLRDLYAASPAIPVNVPWPEWLAQFAHGMRGMLLAYRDGARVFSGTYLTDDSLLTAMEVPLSRLIASGFTLRDAVRGLSTVQSYVVGFTIEQQAVEVRPGERDPRYEAGKRAKRIDGRRFPLTMAAGKELFGAYDERFAHGVALIVTGIGATTGR